MIRVPRLASPFVPIYRPAADVFPGPDEGGLQAGCRYEDWVPNDHGFVKGDDGCWHLFGITHPLTGLDAVHAGENQSFHAVAPPGALRDVLRPGAWVDQAKILPPAARPGEARAHHAPFIVRRNGLYHLLYGPTPLRYATSTDLYRWTPRGILPGAPPGRDPSVLSRDGVHLLVVCGTHEVVMARSDDLVHFREARPILQLAGGVDPESPFLIEHDGVFYLFVCGWDGIWDRRDLAGAYQHVTWVYAAAEPWAFDAAKPIARLEAHAPEVLRGEAGEWYLSSAEWPCRGVSLARLEWR